MSRDRNVDPDKTRVVSKAFRRLVAIQERNAFQGPPENTRDSVMFAATLLRRGEWRKAAKVLVELSCWAFVPKIDERSPKSTEDETLSAVVSHKCAATWDGKPVSELSHIQRMVLLKVKEEGMRTYLLSYSTYYDSMSLSELVSMFELPRAHVHALVSKMMINQELHASWDQPTDSIVLHKVSEAWRGDREIGRATEREGKEKER